MAQNQNSVFATLSAINLNDKVEKKKDLTYLSWTYAWSEVKKHYPNAQYDVEFFNGLPYINDPALGYMVFTSVTIEEQTHMMWLPVMDGANNSMKSEPYKYSTKYGEKTVERASMFDINKTIMRCLVKNLAMFGLGIYIYSGDDLPDTDDAKPVVVTPIAKATISDSASDLVELKKDSDSWAKVVKYTTDNKTLGLEKILQQLGRKYSISATLKKELAKLINNG
jgi:hypothetical protein